MVDVHIARDADPAALAIIDAGIGDFNVANAPLADVMPLCFVARQAGQVVGGAVGRTWGQACELQQLWVRESERRAGIGNRLLTAFEAAASARGCDVVYLETFSFQAPAFYAAQGYATGCRIEGFPGDISKQLMVKRLAPLA